MDRKKDENRREDGGLIVGRNPVLEALKSKRQIDTVYLAGEGGTLDLIAALSKERGAVVKRVSPKKLDFMTGGAVHQAPRRRGRVPNTSGSRISSELPKKRASRRLSSYATKSRTRTISAQ